MFQMTEKGMIGYFTEDLRGRPCEQSVGAKASVVTILAGPLSLTVDAD